MSLMMIAANIPDGLLFGVAPVVLLLVIGLMTWMVKELGKISATNIRMEGRMQNAEQDIRDLQGFIGWPGGPPKV